MENASKALLIAGAILIGILLLVLIVYIANSLQGLNTSYDNKMSTQEILQFNQKILKNLGVNSENKYTATAQQLVSLRNLINELKENNNININIDAINRIIRDKTDQEFLNAEHEKFYIVNIEYNDYGLINKITNIT